MASLERENPERGNSRSRQGNLARLRAAIARLGGHTGFWLKALSQPTIDLTLRTQSGQLTRIVEAPGSSLPPAELEALVAQLRIVAAKTLPQESLSYGIFSGEPERLSRAIITLICEEDSGRPIAFNALSVMKLELDGEPTEVTHLGLVMVDPDVRGQGLSWVLYGLTALVLFARDGLRPKWISNVTQVPAVVGMVSDTFSDVFPSPLQGSRQSFAHLQLARGIMRDHRAVFGVGDDAGFEEARFVITNAYTGGSDALKKTFEVAPKHRNEIYNAFCARELDYIRGDDLLQLGRIDLTGARRYLLSEVPHGSLPALLAASAMLALQRLVLPIVYWLDDTRAFGTLRPRLPGTEGQR
jgi:GNAT superfamily N-acetyltransferase